jgi:hypothetical protein
MFMWLGRIYVLKHVTLLGPWETFFHDSCENYIIQVLQGDTHNLLYYMNNAKYKTLQGAERISYTTRMLQKYYAHASVQMLMYSVCIY